MGGRVDGWTSGRRRDRKTLRSHLSRCFVDRGHGPVSRLGVGQYSTVLNHEGDGRSIFYGDPSRSPTGLICETEGLRLSHPCPVRGEGVRGRLGGDPLAPIVRS